MTAIKTKFTEKYGLETPIAQAGMAFAGMTPDLGIAVSNAGAMGSIAGVGILPPEAVRMLVAGTQAGTDKPFHVNFITIYCTDAHIDLMCEMKPRAVSFHWGDPGQDWIDRLHDAGIDVWEQVGNAEAAARAADQGVDVVIAQGAEAGGHNFGDAGTIVSVPAVRDAVGDRALVLASGGIVDGRGIAAALMLGADGVWMGTRFVASAEAAAADEYKQRILATVPGGTTLTHVFGRNDPRFNPMRVIANPVSDAWEDRIADIPADTSDQPPLGRMEMLGQETPLFPFTSLVPMTGATGDLDQLPMLAGQGATLIDEVRGAADLVAELTKEARACLGLAGQML